MYTVKHHVVYIYIYYFGYTFEINSKKIIEKKKISTYDFDEIIL